MLNTLAPLHILVFD